MFSKAINRFYDFRGKSKRNERVSYYLLFTLIFIIILPFIYGYFVFYNKSFVMPIDGLAQHYTALAYWGHYLRQIVRNVLQGNFSMPLWDFSFGFGADVISTLSFYVIMEPFSLLAVFVPQKNTELLYNFLVILRIYSAGIAFSAFCKKMNIDRFPALCASIIYMFCGFSLFASVRHPYFITPMFFLPLILIGVEKVLKKEKPYVFILSAAGACISNYYFFYMIIILTAIYILIRCLSMNTEKKMKHLTLNVIKFFIYGVISFMIAAPIFIPSLLAMLGTSRANTKTEVSFFYNPIYYLRLIASVTGYESPGSWTFLSFTPIAFVSAIFLFFKRKMYQPIKIGLIVLTCIVLFPLGGYIMNGFSYVNNRWMFGYGFLAAFVTARMLPYLLVPKLKQLCYLIISVALYSAFILMVESVRTEAVIASIHLLGILCTIISIFYIINTEKVRTNLSSYHVKLIQKVIIVAFCIVGVAINAMYLYSPRESAKYVTRFQDKGTSHSYAADISAAAAAKIKDNSFFRYESSDGGSQNSAILNHVNGVSYYFSISNRNISQFLDELALNNTTSFNYKNLDNRTFVGLITGVKYFVNSGNNNILPCGFDEKVMSYQSSNERKYTVYQTDNHLPFGYTYTHTFNRTDYEKLLPTQKQQVLLQAAVLDDSDKASSKNMNDILFTEKEMKYELKYTNGINMGNGKIVVSKTSAKIILSFEGMKNAETYLTISNLRFEPTGPREAYSDEEYQNLNLREKYRLFKDDFLYEKPNQAIITAKDPSGVLKRQVCKTPKDAWYSQKYNFMFNMGYSKTPKNEITISFEKAGVYTFEDIHIVCQPMDKLSSQAEGLNRDVLQNVKFTDNKVTGQISLDTSKILSLSIPYDKGWTAYVNGEKTDLIRVNTIFSGLILDPGTYSIELCYFTPGLKMGLICFLIGLLMFILVKIKILGVIL